MAAGSAPTGAVGARPRPARPASSRAVLSRVCAPLGVCLWLGACASSPQLDAQWTDPSIAKHPGLLRGARVLVACEATDVAVRQICLDQLASEVVARGATPVFAAGDTPIATDRALDGQLLPGARSADARAVLVVALTPAVAESGGSGFSVGIGGFGVGGGRGGGGGIGIGVAAPIGGSGRVVTGFSANGRVTDASSGRLVWTASAVAPPSADLNAQFAALSRAVLDSADKAGLF